MTKEVAFNNVLLFSEVKRVRLGSFHSLFNPGFSTLPLVGHRANNPWPRR